MRRFNSEGPALVVMRGLRAHPDGLTTGQIAGRLDLERPAAASAVTGLNRAGDIRAAGKVPTARAQNYAVLWQATEQGLERLRRTEEPDAPEPEHAAAGSRRFQILTALRDSPAGLTVRGLLAITGEEPVAKFQVWYGNYLRDFRVTGHVRLAGKTAARWQQAPAYIWEITESGRAYLAESESYAAGLERAAAAAETFRKEAAAAELRRAEALAAARAAFARRHVPPHERQPVAVKLRSTGCTLEEIGSVFGVSREQARLDLIWSPRAPRRPGRARAAARICPNCLGIV